MKRALFLLPFLLLGGCGGVDRKAQLEAALPEEVTSVARKANPNSPKDVTECINIGLTLDTPGHYVGIAHFKSGAQANIKVTDDGNSYYLELLPY